jgi:hypothetical protein
MSYLWEIYQLKIPIKYIDEYNDWYDRAQAHIGFVLKKTGLSYAQTSFKIKRIEY